MAPHPSRSPLAHAKLLQKAVANPLVRIGTGKLESEEPVSRWYDLLLGNAPLWSFRGRAFKAYRDDDLPSTLPLRKILKTIAADEGVDLDSAWIPSTDLIGYLYSLRVALSEERPVHPWVIRDDDGNPVFVESLNSAQSFQWIAELDDGPGSEESEYWAIGMEVVRRLEGVAASDTKRERAAAQADLSDFLQSLGTKLARGRPVRGASQAVLDALFEQGKWLFSVCWSALPAEPSSTTRRILQDLGAAESECPVWALRLALPVLSAVETEALMREITKPPGRSAPHTAPRRFTVFSLAHRLGVRPQALAYRLPPQSDAKSFFRDEMNPIHR